MYKISCIISFLVASMILLTGCISVRDVGAEELMQSLQKQGLEFERSRPAVLTATAAFPPTLHPLALLSYERRADTGELVDTLQIQSFPDVAQTDEAQRELQLYADDEYGLGALNLAGPLRYYRCEGNLIVVYQGTWFAEFDPLVVEPICNQCGSAFIQFPSE